MCTLCGFLFSGSGHLQTDRLVAKFIARLTFYDMAHSFDKKHSFSFESIKIYFFLSARVSVCVCLLYNSRRRCLFGRLRELSSASSLGITAAAVGLST